MEEQNANSGMSTVVFLRWYNTILTSIITVVLGFALVKLDTALADVSKSKSDIRLLELRTETLHLDYKSDLRELKQSDRDLKDEITRMYGRK